jgi:uncharacterized protein
LKPTLPAMNLDRRAVLAGSAGLLFAGPAAAIETVPSTHVWQTAPNVPGGIPWSVLASTRERVTVDANRRSWTDPQFPPAVQRLGNQTVKVNGYIMPLQQSDQQQHFVLMAYPPSCPFCMTAGPQYLIEVKAGRPFRFTYDAVIVQGTMRLLTRDPTGFFYRIENARQVRT